MKNHEITFHLDPPSLPENVETLFYLVRLCREPGDPESRVCSEELSVGENVAITNVARGSVYSYSAKVSSAYLRKCQFLFCSQVITTEGESDFSPEDMVETSYTLTEYEQAKADMFGRIYDMAA